MLNHLMVASWFKFIQREVKHWQLWSFGFNVRPWLWLGNGEEGGPTLPLASTREKLRAPRSPLALPPGLGMARKLYRKQGGPVAKGENDPKMIGIVWVVDIATFLLFAARAALSI